MTHQLDLSVLPPKVAMALSKFDLDGNGVSEEELVAAAEQWEASRVSSKSIPLQAFPQPLRSIVKVFDTDDNGCVDTVELLTAAGLYARSRSQIRLLKTEIAGLLVMFLLTIGVIVGLTYGIVDLSKEMSINTDGVMRARSGNTVVGVSTVFADFPLGALPRMPSDFLDNLDKVTLEDPLGRIIRRKVLGIDLVSKDAVTLHTAMGEQIAIKSVTSGQARILGSTFLFCAACSRCGSYGVIVDDVTSAILDQYWADVNTALSNLTAASPCSTKLSGLLSGARRLEQACEQGVQAPLEDPTPVAMLKVMDAVYPSVGAVEAGGWIQYKRWNLPSELLKGSDVLAVFQNSDRCVVAFAGTDDPSDLEDDLNIKGVSHCGYTFHGGFYRELAGFTRKAFWRNEVAPHLATECEGGVIAAGHSLGGALASVLAACASAPGGLTELQGDAPSFTVSALYTAGAPGVSKEQIKGADGGCIPGMRFFNFDSASYDPVPYVTIPFGFIHPKTEAVQFHEDKHDELTKVIYACDSEDAKVKPKGIAFWVLPSVKDHSLTRYIPRAEELLMAS